MTSITAKQHTALLDALDALEEKSVAARVRDDLESAEYLDEQWNVLRVLVNTATIEVEAAQTPDAPALWRDSDREDWKREGPIRLELVAAPYVTVGVSRGGVALIDDDSETVAVDPKHLPALIAMLTEVQRRIEAGEAK